MVSKSNQSLNKNTSQGLEQLHRTSIIPKTKKNSSMDLYAPYWSPIRYKYQYIPTEQQYTTAQYYTWS